MCSRSVSLALLPSLLFGLLLTSVLGGCQTLFSDGNGTSNRGDTGLIGNVRSVDQEQQVADCTFLEEVTVESSPFFGDNDVENRLRNKTSAAGGDVVLITSMEGRTARGEAYECGQKKGGASETDSDQETASPPAPSTDPTDNASPPPSVPTPRVVADSTVEGALRDFVSVVWCGEEGRAQTVLYRAHQIYRYEHCDEIQETLEVVDVRTVVDSLSQTRVAAAFFRYSVGTKIFRDVLWFRRVEGRYARTEARPGAEPGDRWSETAGALVTEAEKWKEGSAVWHD